MATKQQQIDFINAVFPAALKLWNERRNEAIHPLFVTAQAALETGWNLGSIPNNIFGITKGSTWKGATKLVLTTEYFKTATVKFTAPEKVVSVIKVGNRYKYSVWRLFRVYGSLSDCLADHLAILQKSGYADAYLFRNDPVVFAQKISDNLGAQYATAPDYPQQIKACVETVTRIAKETGVYYKK
ncbi:hypothetical protein FACS189434_07900 [Bacteroidia bacterium]|nr:hypothetical protein FACS189434_07900 [Bacteroidia bacterium]